MLFHHIVEGFKLGHLTVIAVGLQVAFQLPLVLEALLTGDVRTLGAADAMHNLHVLDYMRLELGRKGGGSAVLAFVVEAADELVTRCCVDV